MNVGLSIARGESLVAKCCSQNTILDEGQNGIKDHIV